MLISAFAEMISLGSVLPFLAVLTTPDKFFSNQVVFEVATSLGYISADQLLLPLTIAFVIATLMAAIIRLLLLWVSTRLGFAAGADLSIKVYRRALYLPYSMHVARNSSEVINGIMNKVNSTVFGVLLPGLNLISAVVMFVAIMFALLAINPVVATIAAVGFGASYGLITWLVRRRLSVASRRIADEQAVMIKALQEGLGGIRDVLLDGTQPYFCETYGRADQAFRRALASNSFIGQSPRYLMEALGIILIATLAYGLSRQDAGIVTAMPVLGALALGAQRLLPAMQQSYHAWTSIAGNRAALVDTLEMLDLPLPVGADQSNSERIQFDSNITIANLRFRYSPTTPWVLDGVNLTIPMGARVGIVGSTGSGKSTLVDLLMGLLTPTEGTLTVDHQLINGAQLRAWQRSVAHVPQSIYLADGTIAENIAFGIPPKDIDIERVRLAAQQAQISDFIESRPESYDARVGERGIQLSGGQRQRIGIARALYKRASVMFFDEATSALDNLTEESVMKTIDLLSKNLTMIFIAHRITTLKNCDLILEIEGGSIKFAGTYTDFEKYHHNST